MKKLIKKIHVIVLSFVLSISNVLLINQANAQTVGGWTVNNVAAQGAKSIVSASQNVMINGKEYIKKGTALVAPTASQVSKVLARGGAGYALSVAVEQLIGSVDWVLDPANNSIRYWEPTDPTYIYVYNVPINGVMKRIQGAATACQAYTDSVISRGDWVSIKKSNNIVAEDGSSVTCQGTAIRPDGTEYGYRTTIHRVQIIEGGEQEEKTLPLEVVAQKVISNAESGNTDAQTATVAAAQDIVNDAEKDDAKAAPLVNQFENSATTENADAAEQDAANSATGQTKPNTETGGTDLALEFPAFCGWAPVVCEAAQVVISFPAKVELWVKDLLGIGQKVETNTKETADKTTEVATNTKTIAEELTKEDGIPEKDKTDINLPDLPITPQTVNINWGGNCPAPTTTTISFAGQSREITIMRYDFICEWAWVIKFSVVAMASISAVFIISGRKS